MKASRVMFVLLFALAAGSSSAQITITVTQGQEADLGAIYSSTDLIQGLVPVELSGDKGWHPANTDPLDQLPAFTDGQGIRATGLTGLLNDFPGAGLPAKLIQYSLPAPSDIEEIRVFTGNNNPDGRVFHTYTVRFSSDWGQTFTSPVYVQSHSSGTVNSQVNNAWNVVLSRLTNAGSLLSRHVTDIEFDFYAVDNTLGEMRDPFDGVNSFTETDDGLTAAFVSPLVWEIDVLGTNSPPRLTANLSGTSLNLTWVSGASGFAVEAANQVSSPAWADLDPQPVIERTGTTNRTSVVVGTGPRFFRVRVVPWTTGLSPDDRPYAWALGLSW